MNRDFGRRHRCDDTMGFPFARSFPTVEGAVFKDLRATPGNRGRPEMVRTMLERERTARPAPDETANPGELYRKRHGRAVREMRPKFMGHVPIKALEGIESFAVGNPLSSAAGLREDMLQAIGSDIPAGDPGAVAPFSEPCRRSRHRFSHDRRLSDSRPHRQRGAVQPQPRCDQPCDLAGSRPVSPLRFGAGQVRKEPDIPAERFRRRGNHREQNLPAFDPVHGIRMERVNKAAEKAGLTPGAFVRKAAARAAADDLYLYGGGLTPELAGMIEQTFRGVHLLAHLKTRRTRQRRRGG